MQINDFYTAADALTDALLQAGVTHVFLNSGTDYPPLIESWAKSEAKGRKTPEIIISPHETAAMSAAQGFAQLTGKAQAVFVHVDVGTQNLGGTVHNAFRCRVPVFILAGLSPFTMEGELPGGRNAYIQFIQNVADQGGIVREYTKLNYEMRSGKNIQQMALRAMQLACSEPRGPVYLMATREVLEEESRDHCESMTVWQPSAPSGLDDESVTAVLSALSTAKKPLIITSYAGRNTKCVAELARFAEHFAIPVIEVNQSAMNFPADNPLHLGYESHELIGEADLILVIDSDMPWVPARARPADDCRVMFIDIDPLKEHIPLWYIRAERYMKADSYTALIQLSHEVERKPELLDKAAIERRRETKSALHARQREQWRKEAQPKDGYITPEFLSMCVSEVVDSDTVILSEAITSQSSVDRLIPRTKPGTLFTSGGSSLGWHGGAAVGMKLARPDKDIVALTGDGTYIFSCPTAVYWMAARYNAPVMTVIYNNQGWNAPTQITKGEHPDGYAAETGRFWTSFDPAAKLDEIAAAAGGALAITVSEPDKLKRALQQGREAVKKGRSAVINVMLKPV